MVKNKSLEPKPKTLPQILIENRGYISIGLTEGFASISLEENGDMKVDILGDEGQMLETEALNADDIVKIGKFIQDLKSVRLQDYAKLDK